MDAIRQKLCHCRRISVYFGPLPNVSQRATTIHLLGDLFLGFDKSTILEDISVAMSPSQVEARHARRYRRLYRLPLPKNAYFPSTRKLHLYGILPRSSRLFGNLTHIDFSNCFHVEHGHQSILEMLRENRLVEHVSLCHRNSGYRFVETFDEVSHTDLIHLEHLQSLLVEERPTWIRKLLSHLVTPSTASLSLSSDQFVPASGLYSLLPPASRLPNLGAFYATTSISVHAVGRSYSITGWNAEGVKLINIAPYEANARFDYTTPDFLDDGIFLDPLPLNIVTALQFTMAFPADDMSYDMFYDMSYDMSYDTWYDMLRHFPNLRVLSLGGDRAKGAFSCLANNPVHLCSQLRVVHIDNGQFGADAQIEILRFMRARGAMLQRFIVLQDTTEEDIEYTRQVDILFAALRPVVRSANTLRRIPKSSAPPWWQDT